MINHTKLTFIHLKDGDYATIISIETLLHYEKVYNFDIEGNENYYVTEDGILVHNGCFDDLPTRNNVARGDAGAKITVIAGKD